MGNRGMVVVNDRIICNRRNTCTVQQSNRFPENVASVQIRMDMTAPCQVITITVVIARIDHCRLHSGETHHFRVLFRLEPAHKFGTLIGYMIVDQKTGIA